MASSSASDPKTEESSATVRGSSSDSLTCDSRLRNSSEMPRFTPPIAARTAGISVSAGTSDRNVKRMVGLGSASCPAAR